MVLLKESNENQCINFIPRKDRGYFIVELRNEESKEIIYNAIQTSTLSDVSQVCDVFNIVSGVAYELTIYTTSYIDRLTDAEIESLDGVDVDFFDLEVVYLDKVFCLKTEEKKYKTFNDNEKKYKTI